MVTDRIIAELEKGHIPWERPWSGVRSGAYNRISKKPYSLLNQMLLKHDGEYASFKQWSDLGGKVRKGEKSEIVVFWKMLEKEDTNKDGKTVTKYIPYLKYCNVFHISQVDGVEPLPQATLNTEIEPIAEAEKVLNDYWTREHINVELVASNNAYYQPSLDLIHLPIMEQYEHVEEYYSTAFHESVHSTMKQSRCDRQPLKLASFGSDEYSKEELVAEIGSATLLNILGIETPHSFKNHTAYIQNWLQVLKNDNRFIISASTQAEKAVDYILA